MQKTKLRYILAASAISISAAASADAAIITAASGSPPAGALIEQALNGQNDAVNGASFEIGQSFLWTSDAGLASITVQDHNGQARTRDGFLRIYAFASQADALSFTNPSEIFEEAFDRDPTGGASSDYLRHTFTNPVSLVNGSYYAFTFEESLGANQAYKAANNNPYAEGVLARFDGTNWTLGVNNRDMTFYLDAVPEPASAAFLAAALGGLSLRRRR